MALGKKKAIVITWSIIIPLFALLMGLSWAKILDSDWLWPLTLLVAFVAGAGVKFVQKRVDPEAYKAELKEMELEDQAEDEISRVKIQRTWGGTACEFITAMLLILSWILILRDHPSLASDGETLKIAGLCTVGAIWFHVTAYFHQTMGFPSSTVKQLKMCIYRKRALGIMCALFLICGFLIPDGVTVGEWFVIALGLSFVLIFGSKFIMGYVK